MHVAIYGNLIRDQIITLDSPLRIGETNYCSIKYRSGGIANLHKIISKQHRVTLVSDVGIDDAGHDILRELSWQHSISSVAGNTSFAAIIVDKANSIRTSAVRWGACRNKSNWEPIDADWHHIAYLDRVNIDLSKWSKGNISADLCDNNLDISQLKYVDYLFLSAELYDFDAILALPNKHKIIHSPDNITVISNGSMIKYDIVSKVRGLNVLGAGDYFAAHYINAALDNDIDLAKIHYNTLETLFEQSDD